MVETPLQALIIYCVFCFSLSKFKFHMLHSYELEIHIFRVYSYMTLIYLNILSHNTCFVHLDLALCCNNRFSSLCKNLFNLLEFLAEGFRCYVHRKASAKNSSKLNWFLHSEVNLLIQHPINASYSY